MLSGGGVIVSATLLPSTSVPASSPGRAWTNPVTQVGDFECAFRAVEQVPRRRWPMVQAPDSLSVGWLLRTRHLRARRAQTDADAVAGQELAQPPVAVAFGNGCA